MQWRWTLLVGILVAAVAGGWAVPEGVTAGDDVAREVDAIVQRMARKEPGAIWGDRRSLVQLGEPAVATMEGALASASPTAKLGLAGALMAMGRVHPAVDTLLALATASEDREIRTHALRLLGSLPPDADAGTVSFVADALVAKLDDTFHPSEKVALVKTLWRISPENRVRVKDLLKASLESDNPDTRLECALALAEIGDPYSARATLLEFKDDPTVKGDLARSLIHQLEYQERIEMLDRRMRALEEGDRGARGTRRGEFDDFMTTLTELLQERLERDSDMNPMLLRRLIEDVLANLEDHEFLEEIIARIRRTYIERDALTREEMIDAAARGILEALDPHSNYFTGDEVERWSFDLNPQYAGIGAYVNDVEGRFTIIRPIYSGPAYRVGLRSGDWIVEVDGYPTTGRSVEEITQRLKGLPGTKVRVKVGRSVWKEPREFEIVRDNIEIRTVKGRMLPGQIGYVEISNFGGETTEEIEEELRALEQEGMRALVLDLRNNSGGYLTTARQVVDKFLPAGKLIVECRGADSEPVRDARGEWRYFTSDASGHTEVPMVVLVNGASASASEIVAGCLQEHGRAVIVGQRTYGKGSVQNLFPLESRSGEPFVDVPRENGYWDEGEPFEDRNGNGRYDFGEPFTDAPRRNGRWDSGELFDDANGNESRDEGESFTDANRNGRYDAPEEFDDRNGNGKCDEGPHIKVTIARYTLPNGRSIHREVDRDGKVLQEGGVVPNIEQAMPDIPLWILEEEERILESKILETYVEEEIEKGRDEFVLLAEFDGFDPERYPRFDPLYDRLDTRIPKEEVRRLLRSYYVRRKVQDILGREFIEDIQEDVQLQRAVATLAPGIDLDLASIPWYRHFAAKFGTESSGRDATRQAKDGEESRENDESNR